MNNLFKILIGIILVCFALAFIAFAAQNNADILVTVLPEVNFYTPLYVLVLGCFFVGFLAAVIVTRFEYIKTYFSVSNLIKKFKRNKNQSKYVSE